MTQAKPLPVPSSQLLMIAVTAFALAALISVPLDAQVWAGTFGGPNADFAYDVAPAADGGAIAVGFTSTNLWIDGYVVKTDAEGDLLWERTLSLSPLGETFYSVLPTETGGAVIAGSADDPTVPNFRPWLLELDADGQTVWSSEADYTADLPVDSGIVRAVRLNDGRIVVTGGANGMTNPEDPWVLIVDSHGQQQSFSRFETLGIPGFGVATYINNLAATADGGFVATGTVSGGLGIGYLWKFDADGHPEWDRLFQEEAFREGYSVRQATDGGYVLVGCDLPNCNNTAVVRTDAAGEVVWNKIRQDADGHRSFGRDVVERPTGELVMLQTLDSAAGSSTLKTELLTLSPSGDVQTVEPFAVGSTTTAGYRLNLSTMGDLWVAGYANDSSDPGRIDLMLSLVEGQGHGSLIFAADFESGDMSAWSEPGS